MNEQDCYDSSSADAGPEGLEPSFSASQIDLEHMSREDLVAFVGELKRRLRESQRQVDELQRQQRRAQRHRLAAEATGFGTYDFDARTRTSVWSPELHAICGIPEGECIATSSLLDLVHPDDRDRFREEVDRALDPHGPGHHNFVFRITRPGGEVRWLRDSGKTLYEEEGGLRQAARVVGTIEDITDRKATEDQLSALNDTLEQRVTHRTKELHRMSQVFRDATDPIIIEDQYGTILDTNDEVVRLFGWSREELVGKSIKKLVPSEFHRQTDEFLERCRRGDSIRNVEVVRRTMTGDNIPVLLTLSLLSDGEDDDPAIASIAKDLRELKRTEMELNESRALAEMHRDIAYMANTARDLDEAVAYCLERVAYYNGWSFGHAYFPDSSDLETLRTVEASYAVNPECCAALREATMHRPLKRGEGLPGRVYTSGQAEWTNDVEAELTGRRADLAVDLGIRTAAAFPILVGDRVAGVLEFFSDQEIDVDPRLEESMAAIGAQLGRVIERSEAERVLEESEARLRQLTEQLRDVVWLRDAERFEVLHCNSAFETLFERPREILYDDPWASLEAVHPDDRDRVAAAIKRLELGEELDEEFRIVRPDGSLRWVRDRGYPVRDDSGRVCRFAGTTEDITPRKEAARAMKRLEREISDAAEDERRRIARDLHDSVGSQLSAVNFHLQVLSQDIAAGRRLDSEDTDTIARLVEEAIARTRNLTRGLSPVGDDPEDLMVALRDLAASVTEHTTLRCRFWSPKPVAIEDQNVANQLFRIAQESANNAIKHSSGRHLTIGLTSREDMIALGIKDDGRGFEVDRRREDDAGLGLRILQYRADSIGATLAIKARRHRGTEVVCALPRERLHDSGGEQDFG